MASAPETIPENLWAADRRPGAAAAAAAAAAALLGGSREQGPAIPQHTCLDVCRDVKLMARIAMARRAKRIAGEVISQTNKYYLSTVPMLQRAHLR
jgi:hypothetical protein